MADIEEDTYLDAADAMDGPMEPKTPCDWMPTRACVVWTDDVTQHYPVNQCAEVCWRYRRPVEKKSETFTKSDWDSLYDYITGRALADEVTVEDLTKRALLHGMDRDKLPDA